MRLQVFHLKKNILFSDKTVVKRLLKIVVYNVVKWKVEILLGPLGMKFLQTKTF